MRPTESFINQPVRGLQTMLRVIAQEDERQPSVIPDGIYGPQTLQAVTAFQRNHALPVTGVTDQATWDQIHAVYEASLIRVGPAQALELVMDPNQIYRQGDADPDLFIVQAVLFVLSQIYESISPPSQTGVLDEATAFSIETFQEMSNLPRTGELDKITWKYLALHYPLAAVLIRNGRQKNTSPLSKQ